MTDHDDGLRREFKVLLPNGKPICYDQWIGIGANAVVVPKGDHALKLPLHELHIPDDNLEETQLLNEDNRNCLQREIGIYRRLGHHDSIAECLEIEEEGILLRRYRRGELGTFIKTQPEVDRSTKSTWILNLIDGMLHFHNSKVFFRDAALRNILISDEFTLKMIDFGVCMLHPLDTDMSKVSHDHDTIQSNLFELGSLIYSIAKWEEYDFDLWDNRWVIPPLSDLPDTDKIFCGDIIRKCWAGECASIVDLHREAEPMLRRIAHPSARESALTKLTNTVSALLSNTWTYLDANVRYIR